ncbi:unnamed protein product (macronuclear) [Paramecium tetraurelia]|uniref:Uncharacterized protein n=1 Tax=Paramecium tetraurelia TaxID=5888 RepID=A0EHL6_PARTE|nr:uncharacterized protein GSPATT00027133001 [Paramecium tetraurelia]CAK94807.1 unnamed protein product [Paramecium tetraurelia]|eukprot:XP_001462180.1 hypothetical protein (macronuclear) [Paramecium tetraurelia strain d4-2]
MVQHINSYDFAIGMYKMIRNEKLICNQQETQMGKIMPVNKFYLEISLKEQFRPPVI